MTDPGQEHQSRLNVLVVDNNPVLLRAISAFLEREGCHVRCAKNGLEALTLIKEELPDIVFTDLVMPLVGGEQLCKIIRNTPKFSSAYLVVVSAIVLEDLENILSAQYYDFCIAKGTLKELKFHIHEALLSYRGYKAGKENSMDMAKIPEGLIPSSVTLELLSEQRHLTEVFDSLYEGIGVLDGSGCVVNINNAVEKILGLTAEQVIGRNFLDFPWPQHKDKMSAWIAGRRENRQEVSLEITEDDPIQFRGKVISLSLLPASKENSDFSVCILRDITRQFMAEKHEKELNSAMTLMRRMETLSSMAGGVAHDFNNLLTVICGNLDIVLTAGSDAIPPKSSELLANARLAAMKAVELTRKISHSSPFGIVNRVQMPLKELVCDTADSFFQGDEYVIQGGITDMLVNIDPEQIRTALVNVLQNSVEAKGGKPISILLGDKHFESPEVVSGQYVPAGKYAAITVSDDGCGIAKDNILKIFDPYYSTKQKGASKGMGLGLTVVYATIRNHGGYVIVESEKGVGTNMLLLLPLYEVQDTEIQAGEKKQYRVLLVEKDIQSLEICRLMLEFMEYEVLTALTTDEAVVAVEQSRSEEGMPFDILFIDPAQQGEVDCKKLYTTFREIDSDINLVVTGGSTLNPKLDYYRECGFENVLLKPYTHDSIKHVLATAGCL